MPVASVSVASVSVVRPIVARMEAREAFDALVAHDAALPGVSVGRLFRSDGLRVNDKIYAMLVVDRLVVKVPADTVAAMRASGEGDEFTSGGRVMREWVTLRGVDPARWRALADEARAFVAAGTAGAAGSKAAGSKAAGSKAAGTDRPASDGRAIGRRRG
jgi:hypothetical protein